MEKLIKSAIALAAKEHKRQKLTRFGLRAGGRFVDDHIAIEMIVGKTNRLAEKDDEIQRQIRIVKGHIREHTQCPVSIEIIERRLFKGEKLVDLAAELGIGYSTARSKSSRGARYLGISNDP